MKDYKGHSLKQTSLAELPNSIKVMGTNNKATQKANCRRSVTKLGAQKSTQIKKMAKSQETCYSLGYSCFCGRGKCDLCRKLMRKAMTMKQYSPTRSPLLRRKTMTMKRYSPTRSPLLMRKTMTMKRYSPTRSPLMRKAMTMKRYSLTRSPLLMRKAMTMKQ